MSRLQQKCIIASAGMHLLLVLIVLIGPAFVSTQPAEPEMPQLDFIPYKTVDAMVSGGGNPKGSVPKPAPVNLPPQPKPQPVQPPPEPQVAKREVKEAIEETKVSKPEPKQDEQSLEINERRHKVDISKTLVTRKRDTGAEAKKKAEAEERAQERQWAAARQRFADAIGRTADTITSDISSGTSLELKGPGGGGVPYANFNQAVMSVYKRAWSGTVPNDATDDDVAAVASVTIARNGDVIRAVITRSSGRPAVDHSVQAVLERVKYAAPLPEDEKQSQRTVSITFNVNAKKGIG